VTDAACSAALNTAIVCGCQAQNQTQADACEAAFSATNAKAAAFATCTANSCANQCGL
jgi:hypothetical protein